MYDSNRAVFLHYESQIILMLSNNFIQFFHFLRFSALKGNFSFRNLKYRSMILHGDTRESCQCCKINIYYYVIIIMGFNYIIKKFISFRIL